MNNNEAVVRLGLNTTAFENAASKFSSKLKKISGAWQQALMAGGIIAGINSILSRFDDLGDKADNLNISTDFLQGLSHIASQDAVGGVKTLDKALAELNVRLGEARSGSEATLKSFAKWGITEKEIRENTTDEMFLRIADAIKKIPDPTQRAAAAFELLGKSGAKLTGILQTGSDAIRKRIDETSKLDAESVSALGRAKSQIEDITNVWYIGAAKILTMLTKDIPEALAQMPGFAWINTGARLDDYSSGYTAPPSKSEIAEGRRMIRQHKDERISAILEAKNAEINAAYEVARVQKSINEAELGRQLIRLQEEVSARQRILDRKKGVQERFNLHGMPTEEEIRNSARFGGAQKRLDELGGEMSQARLRGDKEGLKRAVAEDANIRAWFDREGIAKDPNKELVAEMQKLTGLADSGALRVLIKNLQ